MENELGFGGELLDGRKMRKLSDCLFLKNPRISDSPGQRDEKAGLREGEGTEERGTHSLLRLSNPEKAPLVSSIVPEMSLWSSSLWRVREKRRIRKVEGGREGGEQGRGLPGLKRFTILAEAALEVTGYPPHPHSLPLPSSSPAPGLKSPSAALLCQPSAFFP